MAEAPIPNWVYDVVMDLLRYEDKHGDHEAWPCFQASLDEIPVPVLAAAGAIAEYKRQEARSA